jgi:raffinose/stachyose/melibiose transport system substrate-binding protein
VGVAVALACGGVLASGVGSASAAVTTITVGANSSEKLGLDAVISQFERANPNIKITPVYGINRAPVLNTQFQAGSAPDVVGLIGGNGIPPSLVQYAKAGYLVNLSSAPWIPKLPSFIKNRAVTFNGTVYAWPSLSYSTGVMYNRTLFKRLGLKVPQTFNQLLALCGAIRDKAPNMTPLAWPGTASSLKVDPIIMSAMSQVYARNPRWDQQRSAGKVKFQTTPGWRTAVGSIVRLRDAKCFAPSSASDSYTQSIGQIAGEQAAMMFAGDVLLPTLRAVNRKVAFGMFPLPGRSKAETYIVMDPGENFAVNAKSKNIRAARDFVDFLAQAEQSRIFSKLVGLVSPQAYARARAHARDQKAVVKTLGKDRALFAPYVSRIVVNPTYTWPSSDVAGAMAQTAQGLFNGQSTVDDVLKAMDTAWSRASK